MGVSPCSNCSDWELSVLLPFTAAALVAHGWCVWRLSSCFCLQTFKNSLTTLPMGEPCSTASPLLNSSSGPGNFLEGQILLCKPSCMSEGC